MEVDIPVRFSKKRAAAIGAKFGKKYPYKEYGRAYLKRGSPISLEQFGPTFKLANDAQKAHRKEMGFVGKGKYRTKGRGGYFGNWLGSLIHPKLGQLMSKAGDAIFDGSRAGRLLDTAGSVMQGTGMYTGKGSYVDNSIIAGDTLPVPSFSPEKDGASVTISHREYISDVYAPATLGSFTNQSYAINVGLERSFPWLSQIAANYEEYEVKQLIYTFRSTVADFASNTGQVGQVIMATQYNSNREPFYEKITMMQYDGAMSGKTSQTQMHGVECDPRKMSGSPGKYVRVGPVLEDQDKNDYDHAQFNIAVADIPNGYQNQSMGELWVSYTVVLRKPKFFTGRGLAISRDLFWGGPITVAQTTYGAMRPWLADSAGLRLSAQQNNIGCVLDRLTNVITFPATFAGNVKIRGKVHFRLTPGTFTANMFANADLTGNVKPILDIAVDNPTKWVFNTGAVGLSATTTNVQPVPPAPGPCPGEATNGDHCFVFEIHVRVAVATGGLDNQISIGFAGANNNPAVGFPAGTTIDSSWLDIEEYNIGLNYALNGSNDEVKFVDQNGLIVNI